MTIRKEKEDIKIQGILMEEQQNLQAFSVVYMQERLMHLSGAIGSLGSKKLDEDKH